MAVVAISVAGCGAARHVAPAMVRATPANGLYDVSRSIVVSHLDPGEVVTISASARRPGGLWSASATYKADGAGVVDLTRAAPQSGSYRGVSAMGLFWSEHLVRAGSTPAGTTVTRLSVTSDGQRIGSATVTQSLLAAGVTEHVEALTKVGFVGQYFTPPGDGRHASVILWGGSEGALGQSPQLAALFASHGIPALAIAYFDEAGLPCALNNIPLEYFEKAIRWLRSQPQVNPRRVWIQSASRGSEAALLVATNWPTLVHGVIVAAPSSVAWGANPGNCQPLGLTAWTLHGQPVDTAISTGSPTRNPDGSISDRDAFLSDLASPSASAARIPIERFKGPVMLISGGDDELWPSPVFADRIMDALHADPADHVHLNYPAAGHLVLGPAYAPAPVEERVVGPLGRSYRLYHGGSEGADAAARASDWPAMLSFIASN